MSDLRRLFEQEMRALQEEGADFAKDFPEAARFLDFERLDERDPYVERLTESFAFLTARVREALSTQQDGLTQHLLELVAPDLDQPLPSVAVVEFIPRSDFSEATLLPVGSEVVTTASTGGVKSPFVLLNPVAIDLVALTSARLEITETNQNILELELVKTSQNKGAPWPETLPLFLLGDSPVVWAVRFGLLRRLAKIQVFLAENWVDAPEIALERLDQPSYASQRGLPSPLAQLRDFLCADERFRFVSLSGFGSLTGHPSLRLRLHFQGALPRGMARAITKDLFRLHTGVFVNRFVSSCQALAWDHSQPMMVVQANGGSQREIMEVVSVEGLTATQPPRRISYRKFANYRHDSGHAHYQMVRTINRKGNAVVGLSLGTTGSPDALESQYLAIQAICSDGEHPHDNLQPGDLNSLAMDSPPRVGVSGLTRPTSSFRPPELADPRSRLLAFSAGHFDGWLDAPRLKDALRHVMWDPAESKRTLIEAIQDVTSENGHIFVKGVAWRQMVTTIRLRDTTCTPDTWERLGVIDAFGSVLLKLIQEETPIGSRTRLRILVDPAGVVLEWEN